MRITEIEAIPVDVPRTPRVRIASAYGEIPSARFVLVVVRTDDGMTGLGEASPELDWTGEDIHSCWNCIRYYLAPALIGHDPLRIQSAMDRMEAVIAKNPYAKAAVEMALWDITGKQAGLPLAELWGGRVREAVDVKFVVSGPPERAGELANQVLAEGFRYIKIKTGLDVRQDIKRVRAVRDAVGEEIPVGVDSNMGWSYAEALWALPRLEEQGVAFIEQPFNRYPRAALAEYRRLSRIPIVAHESLFTLDDALQLLTDRAADIWAITPSTHGGYLATREILGLARAGQIPCLLGSTIELGINSAFMAHIGLSSPSIDGTVPSDVIGPFYHERDIVQERFELENGAVVPPDGPGLGVSLDDDAVEAYRIDKE
ncbi:MAG: mandelate racemase/muconate lactonizing protein [Proteobacteria bacterium]|nr:mandelate racemase/muconate lactonizing protein [Pseudomonadota bacterium]